MFMVTLGTGRKKYWNWVCDKHRNLAILHTQQGRISLKGIKFTLIWLCVYKMCLIRGLHFVICFKFKPRHNSSFISLPFFISMYFCLSFTYFTLSLILIPFLFIFCISQFSIAHFLLLLLSFNPNLPGPFWGCSVSIWSQSHFWRLEKFYLDRAYIIVKRNVYTLLRNNRNTNIQIICKLCLWDWCQKVNISSFQKEQNSRGRVN